MQCCTFADDCRTLLGLNVCPCAGSITLQVKECVNAAKAGIEWHPAPKASEVVEEVASAKHRVIVEDVKVSLCGDVK